MSGVKELDRLDLPCILESSVTKNQEGDDKQIDDRTLTVSRVDARHLCARAIQLLATALSNLARDLV